MAVTKMPRPTSSPALATTAATASDKLRLTWLSSMFSRRSQVRSRGNSWDNFLLGCVNCNSSKGSTHLNLHDYFWPDRDNTLRAFEYMNGGLMRPHADLVAVDRVRAGNTIALTGLDKDPGNARRTPTDSDRRWERRREIWQMAKRNHARLARQDTHGIREAIVDCATARGMFSIWWTVFADDVDMRRRFREAFIGTDAGSFDCNENPMPRAGGQL